MNTPADFISSQLEAPYPRWDVLCKIPPSVAAPFYVALHEKWRDRNVFSLGQALAFNPIMSGVRETDGGKLTDQQLADVQTWLEATRQASGGAASET